MTRTLALIATAAAAFALIVSVRDGDDATAGPSQGSKTTESNVYGFVITQPVNHQGDNTINVSVAYRYRQGIGFKRFPDVLKVEAFLRDRLSNYRNTTDYWEVFNRRVTNQLFDRYRGVMDALRVEIDILPGAGIELLRTSVIDITREGSPPVPAPAPEEAALVAPGGGPGA
jgi:hypothetical protein